MITPIYKDNFIDCFSNGHSCYFEIIQRQNKLDCREDYEWFVAKEIEELLFVTERYDPDDIESINITADKWKDDKTFKDLKERKIGVTIIPKNRVLSIIIKTRTGIK